MAFLTGEKEPAFKKPSALTLTQQSIPIEHRYTMDDFETFFSGYGLDIRGTVSGLDVYPPEALHHSPSREQFGKLSYNLYKEIDKQLFERNLDLLAKHWVIFAKLGDPKTQRKIPAKDPDYPWDSQTKGPYDVEYLHYIGSRRANAKETIWAEVGLRNNSFRVWSSTDKESPDYLSYHWLRKNEVVLVQDGERSPLPRPVGPGEKCEVSIKITMPDKPGRYLLAVDLVRENRTWFSEAGSPFLKIPFHIRKQQ